jgi:predicted enzyme related to lactoylglutathione lyase
MTYDVQFDLYAQNPARAAKFYKDVFGWRAETWAGPWNSWLITTGPDSGPGMDGGLCSRPGQQDRGVNTIEVPSLEETEGRIKAAGGQILEPAFRLPGVGWYALCADTEGNRFGLMQADPRAD